ncbi:MAG: serine/threonine-protein kinase [Gemmatimonadales bacterium]|nr:serine/threonine-protein kinase [Gemmatimonadales bacterium]
MPDTLETLRSALTAEYNVLGEVGRGGMATVYLGLQRKPSRKVAIKVMDPAVPSPTTRERFRREIELAGQLSHPHIVPIFAAGEAGDLLYYVMPYIEGEALRARLEREPKLTLGEILHFTRDAADALAYAHAHGIIHRDIKPENILISEGHTLVADFGLARACDACGFEKLTMPDKVMGTPGYMSPEQAMGSAKLDERTDIYSLGCVLYEMLVGEPPASWPDRSSSRSGRLTDTPPEHRRSLDLAPRELERVLAKALAKEPEDRFATAAEFHEALEDLSAGRPAARPRRFWRVAVAVAAVVVALAAAVALILRG